MSAVEASVAVAATPEELFARLSRLENHWALADRWVEVVSLNGPGDAPADGGVVRLHGPLGVRRTARTTVESVDPPRRMQGMARIGERTTGAVSWTFEAQDGETLVTLRGELVEASVLDRALWALGGQAWMARRLRITLDRLRAEYLPR